MLLLGLTRYAHGYTGFLDDGTHYVLFRLSRKKSFGTVQAWPKSDFSGLDHFVSVVSKTTGRKAFFGAPVPIASPSMVEFHRCFALYNPSKKRDRCS